MDMAIDRAFGTILAVVAESLHDLSQRPDTGAEIGTAAVVLETDQAHAAILAGRPVDDDVADQAPVAPDGVDIQHANAGQLLAGMCQEIMSQQLVATADRQDHEAILDRGSQARSLPLDKILGNQRLAAILATSEERQIIA